MPKIDDMPEKGPGRMEVPSLPRLAKAITPGFIRGGVYLFRQKKRSACDLHRDPQAVWAGKTEHTSSEEPPLPLPQHAQTVQRKVGYA